MGLKPPRYRQHQQERQMGYKRKMTEVDVPGRFVPVFWADVDQRSFTAKQIRRRYELLKADSGVQSYQQDLLAQRAVFLSIQLETMEIKASEGKQFDAGQYVQATNALLGILKALGLERQIKKVVNLKAYVKEKEA